MKKSKDDAETYFAHLDIGSGVKMGGITFGKQGVPHLVPQNLVKTFENSPVFGKVDDPEKVLSPGECASQMKKEMAAYTVRRDNWRKEHKAELVARLKEKQEQAIKKKAATSAPSEEARTRPPPDMPKEVSK